MALGMNSIFSVCRVHLTGLGSDNGARSPATSEKAPPCGRSSHEGLMWSRRKGKYRRMCLAGG